MQLIPEPVTVPVPVPEPVTASWYCGAVKPADTLFAELIVTLQAPVPLHEPPHPLKVDPPVGVAVSGTTVPDAKLALHVPLATPTLIVQLIPPPVTDPCPLPLPVTVSA